MDEYARAIVSMNDDDDNTKYSVYSSRCFKKNRRRFELFK